MEDIELNTLNIKEKVLKNDLQAYRPQNKRCSTVEHVWFEQSCLYLGLKSAGWSFGVVEVKWCGGAILAIPENSPLLNTGKFFFPLPPHVHIDFVVPLPGCGRSVTDFWGWGAHRARLPCPSDVSDDMYERRVPEGALNLNSTGYPEHGRQGNLPLQGKIPTAEPGIEPGASWLVVRSSDQQATGWSYKEK
jgi:hypothetical protein